MPHVPLLVVVVVPCVLQLGVPDPKLSKQQADMAITRTIAVSRWSL